MTQSPGEQHGEFSDICLLRAVLLLGYQRRSVGSRGETRGQKTCKMINDPSIDGFHPSIFLDPKISDTFTSPKLKDENILSKPFQGFVYLLFSS